MPRAKSGLPGWTLAWRFKGVYSRVLYREQNTDLYAWFSLGENASEPPLPRGWWCSEEAAEVAHCHGPFPSLEAAQIAAELLL